MPPSLNIFANGLQKLGKTRANSDDIFTALGDVYSMCQGAFACTAMIAGFGVLGFRQVASTCVYFSPQKLMKAEMPMAFAPSALGRGPLILYLEQQITSWLQNLLP